MFCQNFTVILLYFSSIFVPLRTIVCNKQGFFSLASSFLKQALEGEYPKLLQLYNELWRRLQQYSASLQGALTSGGGIDTSLDITAAETDSQDLFTHGQQDYK